MLPNPAPAVVALLEGVPTWGRNVPVELTTPTGAALLAALSSGYGPMPPMRVTGQGFGAGSRELDELPNCTQVVTGVAGRPGRRATARATAREADAGQPVALLEANVDDATGEQLAHAVGALLEAGAHDAWLTPVIMKKGRPGTVVHVLGDPSQAAALRDVLRDTTGSLGRPGHRRGAVAGGPVHPLGVGRRPDDPGQGGGGQVKAEYEDVALASRRTGRPLREVAFRAEARWREEHEARSGDVPGPAEGGDDEASGAPDGGRHGRGDGDGDGGGGDVGGGGGDGRPDRRAGVDRRPPDLPDA